MTQSASTMTKGILSFWSWNDHMDLEHATEQVREFHRNGYHGFFIHARGGLEAGYYLSDEWMQAVTVVVEEAARLDMEVWLYDEEAWPSGFCGGEVPRLGKEYQQKWISSRTFDPDTLRQSEDSIAWFFRFGDGSWTFGEYDKLPANATEYRQFYYERNVYYSDLLSADTVRKFIELTHERYRSRLGSYFGKVIKGVFTDEPQFAVGRYPWTTRIEESFQEEYGYSLVEHLPELFDGDSAALNHDYWKLISKMFTLSFMQQIGKWCEEHGLVLTGHVAGEDTLIYQMTTTGGAMPFYEWMQMPGIDHLGNRITRPVLLKQVSSVARQLGKKQVLSEMFGCSGWDASFSDFRWIAEWQLAQGVNVQTQHLSSYTIKGARKRDYPPSFSYHQPWWNDTKFYSAYFERLYEWLRGGKTVPNILVLHPLSSAWCVYRPDQPESLWEMDRRLGEITKLLIGEHHDFDYADETIMARHGSVQEGKLLIGAMSYSIIIAPALVSIGEATFRLLRRFAEGGGTLIQLGQSPERIDGRKSEEITAWWDEHARRGMPTVKTIRALIPADKRSVRVIDDQGKSLSDIHVQVRWAEDGQRIFLLNSDRYQPKKGHVVLSGDWEVREFNPETGMYSEIRGRRSNNCTYVALQWSGGQSYCLAACSERSAQSIACSLNTAVFNDTQMLGQEPIEVYRLSSEWQIGNHYENVLTLDMASYRYGEEGDWGTVRSLLHIQQHLEELKQEQPIALKFRFEVDPALSGAVIELAMEDIQKQRIFLNGIEVREQAGGYYLDLSIQRIPVSSYLIAGMNELVLMRTYRPLASDIVDNPDVFESERNRYVPSTNLESVYLLGLFRTLPMQGEKTAPIDELPRACRCHATHFKLMQPLRTVESRSFTEQGLWFFSGQLEIAQLFAHQPDPRDGYRVVLSMSEPFAAVVGIYVNDREVATRLWAPYRFDITDFLIEGTNRLTIRLTSGLRNTLGPHHHQQGELGFVGPSTFKGVRGWEDLIYGYDTPDNTWHDAFHFVPFGLKGQPELIRYRTTLR